MIIGLTGSIASGKSTVSTMLKEKGYPVVDADEIARLVVEPGTEVIAEIERVFGRDVINEDSSLNREQLGKRIFGNPNERNQLNSIIHPAIRKEMLKQRDKWLSKGEKTVVMDIPLLFESGLEHFAGKILVVSVNEKIQKQRLMERNNLTEEEAMARIRSQLPMKQKEEGADGIIDNNGSIEESKIQLEKILKKWDVK